MSKITREASKNRFKKGMYPTEQDFANLHDSYVHKDDTIEIEKIVSGDTNIVDLINGKAEQEHEHAISEVEGLEDALSQVYAILGKANGETIAELASKFASLTNGYSDVYTFVETVKNFLEETDASNDTINRWNEIENFLQGITDSETLTGLLENLKSEIMGEVENLLNDKADRSDLDNLQSSVSSLESTVNDKADKSDLDNLQSSVSSLESTVNDKADRSELDYKADKGDLDNLQSSVSSLESTVNDKADTNTVNSIDERVSALENAEPVEQKVYTAGEGIDISEEGVISLKEDENKLDCLKVIADLDASNAPVGTIAIYSGATNEKYTHGFVYEKTGEGGEVIPAGSPLSVSLGGYTNSPLYGKHIVNTGRMVDLQPWVDKCPSWSGADDKLAQVVAKTGSTMGYEAVTYDGSLVLYYAPMDRNNYLAFYDGVESMSYGYDQFGSSMANTIFGSAVTDHDITLPGGDGASWTPLNVMNVIG